jgi:hypothetical protein
MTDSDRRTLLQLLGAGVTAGLAGCGVGVFSDGTKPNKGNGDDNSTENGEETNNEG